MYVCVPCHLQAHVGPRCVCVCGVEREREEAGGLKVTERVCVAWKGSDGCAKSESRKNTQQRIFLKSELPFLKAEAKCGRVKIFSIYTSS